MASSGGEHGVRRRRARLRRPVTWVLPGVVAVVLAAGLWVFQPWRLFTHSTLNEELPAGTATSATAPASGPPAGAPAPVTALAQGAFVGQEHATRGTAQLIQLGDGSRFLRLTGFSTSDGPALQVWLTDREAGGDWHQYDDGRYVSLGPLKATDGNQNYPIAPDVRLAGLRSVVIWCVRFTVAFGSAPLSP